MMQMSCELATAASLHVLNIDLISYVLLAHTDVPKSWWLQLHRSYI
jgi:hypothetical protein